MFALVDCNNFYVSCERVFRPDLNLTPVIILSNNDGCIIARSGEAKALGLKMGEPVFRRKSLIRENQVQVFSSNYTLYGDLSQRVMDTLRQAVSDVEVYSIDEAFLELGNIPGDLNVWAKKLIRTVWRNTGIPVSVGIGPTKTLAKIASKAAKQGTGTFVIRNNRHRDCLIRNTPVEKVWGIGRQYHKLLYANHIYTAFDFTQTDDLWLRQKMKVMGLRIKKELLGESCLPMEEKIPTKKAIATTRAFGKKTSDLRLLKEAVATYAARCAEKLRRQRSTASLLTVFIHTDPFSPQEPQYSQSKSLPLPVETNSTKELICYALMLLDKLFHAGYRYKKAGVIVDGLKPEQHGQLVLFQRIDREKEKILSRTIDELNRRMGRDKIRMAILGDGKEWKLRQENLSQRYTTNWEEIPVANV
jgi:DNA polymerase V